MTRRHLLAVMAIAAGASSANAFFPPVVAPISPPVSIVRDPVKDPIKLPPKPIDPCVKPKPKPRPKPEYCGCSTANTAKTPEPATIISTGIGLAIAGAVSYVKKRKRTPVA
jgi:hypothetical protein